VHYVEAAPVFEKLANLKQKRVRLVGVDRKNDENGRAMLLANIINGFKKRNRSGRGGGGGGGTALRPLGPPRKKN
jgi:hypothetical protein